MDVSSLFFVVVFVDVVVQRSNRRSRSPARGWRRSFGGDCGGTVMCDLGLMGEYTGGFGGGGGGFTCWNGWLFGSWGDFLWWWRCFVGRCCARGDPLGRHWWSSSSTGPLLVCIRNPVVVPGWDRFRSGRHEVHSGDG